MFITIIKIFASICCVSSLTVYTIYFTRYTVQRVFKKEEGFLGIPGIILCLRLIAIVSFYLFLVFVVNSLIWKV